MLMENQSSKDFFHLKLDIFIAKVKTRFGCWNVRFLWSTGRLTQVIREMKTFVLSIDGLSEMRWTGQGKLLSGGMIVLYSGREDDNHWEGMGLLLSKEATKAMKEWEPVN